MSRRILIVAAALAGALLAGGCVKTFVPSEQEDTICFRAQSLLLQDDAPTKAAAPLENSFKVFGKRNNSFTVFSGDSVSPSGSGTWTYSPLRFWLWERMTDYYDFVGVSPVSAASTAAAFDPDAPAMTVKVPYDATATGYDLVMSAVRRLASETQPRRTVELEFYHMLSKVEIVVENTSDDPQALTVDSFHFEKLVTSAKAKATFNTQGQGDLSWSDPIRSGASLGSASPDEEIDAGDDYSCGTVYMIPQRLDVNPGNKPKLVLNYSYTIPGESEEHKSVDIDLDQITLSNGNAITRWDRGVHYTYTIRIRIGGDVQVILTTTEWDVTYAETPGLLI